MSRRGATKGIGAAGIATIWMVALGVLAGPAQAAPPIFESNFGTPVAGVTNQDDGGTAIPMGTFTFPFYGVTHAAPETFGVNSNGFIELNSTGNPDNTPTGAEARLGAPKIGPLWSDLNLANVAPFGDVGTVFENTFNDDGDPAIDRVVFTWDAAFFGCEGGNYCHAHARAQVQLLENGRIIFGYDGVATNQAVDDYFGPVQPTIARGGFVQPPGPPIAPPGTDFSEAVPFTGGDLIFEQFAGNGFHFDLDQTNLIFDPNGGGYNVSSPVDISVATTASKPKVKAGKKVTYASVITNSGAVPVDNVALKDTLPAFAKVTSATGCGGKVSPVVCSVGSLAPGATATVNIVAKLNETGTVYNRVNVGTTTPGDGHSNNLTETPVTVTAKKKAK